MIHGRGGTACCQTSAVTVGQHCVSHFGHLGMAPRVEVSSPQMLRLSPAGLSRLQLRAGLKQLKHLAPRDRTA